jgi:hypothetical protein
VFKVLMRCDAVDIWPCLALLFMSATGHIEKLLACNYMTFEC